jgi:hypothetical protein
MCSPDTAVLIKQVVTQRVDNDELFTAFDISLAVKELAKQAGQSPERHRDMKGAIHQEMSGYLATGVYRRELVDVGAPTKAFVYYPDGVDPNNYVPMTKTKTVSVKPPPALPAATADDEDEDEGDGRRVDARGSLSVPSHLVASLGLNTGERVFVLQDQRGLRVSRTDGAGSLASYVVDKNRNVRITRQHLAFCGFSGQDTFDFGDDNGDVLIRKH